MIWLALILAAGGYPDGAPWGHAGRPQTESCQTCHWDNEVETASPRLSLDGLPDRFESGGRYVLTVRLSGASDANGFQLVANSGRFSAVSAQTETNGASIRSTVSAGAWQFVWVAGDANVPAHFWLAVNDANGDGSELGDRILLREFESLP